MKSLATTDATEFSFSSGAFYADKDELVAKSLVFTIGRIEFQQAAGYQGADRWAIYVQPEGGRPEEIITLQSNDGRDPELKAAAAHIEKCGPIRNTKLVKSGRAYFFRKAAETKDP